MDITHQLVTIFCEIDDFRKGLEGLTKNKLLTESHSGKRGPTAALSISEIMTIMAIRSDSQETAQ